MEATLGPTRGKARAKGGNGSRPGCLGAFSLTAERVDLFLMYYIWHSSYDLHNIFCFKAVSFSSQIGRANEYLAPAYEAADEMAYLA